MSDATTVTTPAQTETEKAAITAAQRKVEAASSDPLPAEDPTRLLAEKTLTALDYEQLLLRGFVEQSWSMTKQIKVKFKSLGSDTAEFIFRALTKKYGEDWTIIFDEAARKYYVAATLQLLNDSPLAKDSVDDFLAKGDTDNAEKCLEERLRFVGKLPWALTNLLYAHYLLFSKRVDEFLRTGDEPIKKP